jgi:hypothetical protein
MVLNVMQDPINEVVPGAGVEPAPSYEERILSPFEGILPNLT